MKLIVLLSDFCNDEFLADVLLVIPVRRLEIGGLAVFVWKNCEEKLNPCWVVVNAGILCISAEGFPCFSGFEGFPVLHCCVLGLESWALQQAECSERSQALQVQCPHRLHDSAQCCWRCSSKVVSDCIRAGTDAEPRALRSHCADF